MQQHWQVNINSSQFCVHWNRFACVCASYPLGSVSRWGDQWSSRLHLSSATDPTHQWTCCQSSTRPEVYKEQLKKGGVRCRNAHAPATAVCHESCSGMQRSTKNVGYLHERHLSDSTHRNTQWHQRNSQSPTNVKYVTPPPLSPFTGGVWW